jgi:hypothetical protein
MELSRDVCPLITYSEEISSDFETIPVEGSLGFGAEKGGK